MNWCFPTKRTLVCNSSPNRVTYAIPAENYTSLSSPTENVDQFEKDCLDEHNRRRQAHGCPPLTLNRNLCHFAKQWADNLASRNTLEHRTNNKYGENLYMSGGVPVDGRTPVKSWYDEIAMYNYGRPAFAANTGHFSQVVWKSSRELGVAFAKKGNNVYVVANYDPPGNYANQFIQNVPRKV